MRRESPPGPFDLVLCRNLAFTYFDVSTQRRLAGTFAGALQPAGILIIGRGERVPDGVDELRPVEPEVYVRGGGGSAAAQRSDASGEGPSPPQTV